MVEADLIAIVARNIRRLRQAKGWSQERLASECDLHRTYVGAIERCERNITLETLHRLADGLGCTAGFLISEMGESA